MAIAVSNIMLKLTVYLNQNTSLYKMEKSQVISKNLKNACFLLWSSSLLIFLTTLGKNELEWFHINRLLKARKITTHHGSRSWRQLLLYWNDVSKFIVSNFQSRLTTSSRHVHSEPHNFNCTSVCLPAQIIMAHLTKCWA